MLMIARFMFNSIVIIFVLFSVGFITCGVSELVRLIVVLWCFVAFGLTLGFV